MPTCFNLVYVTMECEYSNIALRLLAERRREYRQPLYAAYIDLRAAFDSLDRNSLWNILKTIGIPPKLVDIIKTLYSSTHSVVRVNGTISEAFSISSGVRQGCVLAANLFNTATDRILNNTTQALTLGVIAVVIFSTNSIIAMEVDIFFLKPYCLKYSKLLELRKFINLLLKIFSRIFENCGKSEIGL